MTMAKRWRQFAWIAWLAVSACPAGWAQSLTASGTVNAILVNQSAIALIFDSDPSGVALGANGSPNASLNFHTISPGGPLAPGITRTTSGSSFTVSTYFDLNVIEGGLTTASYTLSVNLAGAAPQGLTYQVDTLTLSQNAQTLLSNGTYNTDVKHSLSLQVSTAAPGAGGPAVGTPLTATINFVATSN